MLAHRDFESNCKRIARYVMKQASNPASEEFSDMICLGRFSITVSEPFVKWFNAEIKRDKKMLRKFNGEINRHLKGCSVQWDTIGKDERWLLVFYIEFDDPDPEFEDW